MSEAPKTYWNGEPTPCERVAVIVADSPRTPLYWARDLVGTERKAIAINYNGETFFIDDEGYTVSEEHIAALRERFPSLPDTYFSREQGYPGWGWEKVTKGQGGPSIPHASLAVERIVETEHDHAV